MKRERLKIAILGTRGVPARYGGFETFAAELSRRLAARGHDLTVYCRSSLYPDAQPYWEGVRRIDLPAIRHKYFETVSHAFVSALDALRRDFDVVLVCNAANAFVIPILHIARQHVAINVDGIERKRKKWNVFGRAVYLAGEAMSARYADRLIADANVIAAYYRAEHATESTVITYGSDFPEESDTDVLTRLGIESRRYLLYVSRMEPENNPLAVVDAYREAKPSLPLVMIGSAPYSGAILDRLREEATSGIIWPGALYGADYRTLQRHALLYIQATEVGGTHPALIEAMGSGGAVAALDTPENREVGADAVIYFSLLATVPATASPSLAQALKNILDAPELLDVYRSKARGRAARLYGWEAITDQYEQLFLELAG